MFFLTLSIYCFLKSIEKGGLGWVLVSSFVVVLTLFSKYSTWTMLLVLPLIVFVYQTGEKLVRLRRVSAAVAVIACVLFAVVFLAKYGVFLEQINMLRTYQWGGLKRWQEGYISTFFFQVHPFISILALFAIYKAVREKDRRFLIPGWFVIFVFLLQIQRIRYILPLFPLFTLMASYGLNAIEDKEVKRFAGFCVVSSSIVILLAVYLPFFNKTSMANLQHAGRFLNTLENEAAEVYVLPQIDSSGNIEAAIPILDLYTNKRLFYNQGIELLNPGEDIIEKSSLRFTWSFKTPGFYSERINEASPLVIISSKKITKPPIDTDNLKKREEFVKATDAFKYKTFVTIYKYTNLSRTDQ
jgi:4-amino-4-deoxy-L-arabinose transferase-like glycosyltransferase